MKVSIKYFASIRESVGVGSEQIDTAALTLKGLRDELIARGGAHAQSLARGRSVRVALNQVMSEESAPLVEGCEVAFFPPVTGG
jgi:sulfur-carrier protein